MEEPWLRGPIPGIHPLLAPLFYAFQQAREDLARHTEGLTASQMWAVRLGAGSVGFHLRHIAGSTDRLMSYLEGRDLTTDQLTALKAESSLGQTSREELLSAIDEAFARAEAIVRSLDPSTLTEPRTVGRKRLPTTVIGLLTHIAEHTQRHVGEAIVLARAARE